VRWRNKATQIQGQSGDHRSQIPELPKQKFPHTPSFFPEQMSPSALIERVTRRAERGWRRNSDAKSAAADGVTGSRSSTLGENWSTTVAGVRASGDYIAELAASGKHRYRPGSEAPQETFRER